MNQKKIEDMLEQLAQETVPDDIHRLEEETTQQVHDTLRQQLQKESRRFIMQRRILKLGSAAAIIICGVGLLVFVGNEDTLYAQVVKAFEKAHSAHIIMTEYRNGHWFKDHEVWYDFEEGTREEERFETQVDIRIDNTQYEWRYTVGDKLVAQVASYRDQNEWAQSMYDWIRLDSERDTSGDKVINGIPCEFYILSLPSQEDEKAGAWVDGKHRVLEIFHERNWLDQEVRSVATIEYDIEIDNHLFFPKFEEGVEIVGPRELIEELFSLETAIFKRESLGFVYAVHQLELGDGYRYLVCSNRLTEQTRDEISDGNPWTYYGGFDLFGRYDEDGDCLDTSDKPITLARMTHDGIQVDWYILIPRGNKARQTTSCDVDVRVNTTNQLEEKLKAEGQPIREKFRLNVETPEDNKEQLLSLSEICSEVYSLGEEFDPLVHAFNLTRIIIETDGNRVQAWKKPGSELSEEEYRKDIENRANYYLNQN